ncbi:MAG: hypothetical protein JO247_03755 [Chloroflexi bacterium]|nr:hypothetical protein [Chloroflexota bacterium]
MEQPIEVGGRAAERDNGWLGQQLDYIWRRWFPDVDAVTPVSIRFVRPWKRRLAVIYLTDDEGRSFIGVNRYLRDPRVPYTVCLVTIAHELVHYAHGFGSHHPRRYQHPHRGNVVQRELTKRGLGEELGFYTDWTNDRWFELLPDLVAGPRSTETFPTDLERQAAARVD